MTLDRQTRIEGWRQDRLSDSVVAVYGVDRDAVDFIWALQRMGLRRILWILPESHGQQHVLHHRGGSGEEEEIWDYPVEEHVRHENDLTSILAGHRLDFLAVFSAPRQAAEACARFARSEQIDFVTAIADQQGGCVTGSLDTIPVATGDPAPATSLAVAGLCAEVIRHALSPLADDLPLADGSFSWGDGESSCVPASVAIIGVGGIGTILAYTLASCGIHLHLMDDDQIDATNLNRQILFDPADIGKNKAHVAAEKIRALYPSVRVVAYPERFQASFPWNQAPDSPQIVLSAVDNAETRLALQQTGRQQSLTVVQGGTDTFAADCFVQRPQDPLLDEQMHGALTRSVANEQQTARSAGCDGDPAYVVPSMMAAAMMAHRCTHLDRPNVIPGLHWRAGSFPVAACAARNAC